MAFSKNNGGPISDINVTPLVDIMLVLVIILMVTAEFTRYKTIPVHLPKVNAAAVKTEPHRITVTIKKAGDIYVQDKAATDLNDVFEQI
ncbi:MAG TPA: biopolymer transporter ExbD, partial [Turneriella sp.]|nr:biopolymer transporter ExbD [Turneriella sp.]